MTHAEKCVPTARPLKDKFTQKWNNPVLIYSTPTLTGSRAKFRGLLNISGALQEKQFCSILLNNWIRWGIVLKSLKTKNLMAPNRSPLDPKLILKNVLF